MQFPHTCKQENSLRLSQTIEDNINVKNEKISGTGVEPIFVL